MRCNGGRRVRIHKASKRRLSQGKLRSKSGKTTSREWWMAKEKRKGSLLLGNAPTAERRDRIEPR